MKNNNTSIFFTDGAKVKQSSLVTQFAERLEFDLVKDRTTVTDHDILEAISMAIRDRLTRNWLNTQNEYNENNVKKVHYLSLEFLMGSLLGNSLINLGLYEETRKLLESFGYDLDKIMREEPDMGLGNGGLGRLAACYMESLATLGLPAYGYGILYEYGIFEQDIENGYQIEKPDHWLRYGNPWKVVRPEFTYTVKFSGAVSTYFDETGRTRYTWVNTDDVLAIANDVPVPGYQNKTVNTLRLWQAKSTDEFNLNNFNQGNYLSAVENKNLSETISKVLYPNDSIPQGKILRLRQQYFFVSATLQDIIYNFKLHNTDFKLLPEKAAIQLNDTHPAIAIPDLMRILMDDEGLEWKDAWDITQKVFAYTNHTIVPEALEEWSESLLHTLLPRHMQIITEINRRFTEEVKEKYSSDENVTAKMAIIHQSTSGNNVRMANLAIVGSHSTNGVAELHSDILKKYIFPDLNNFQPGKFNNKTNGISIRRFLLQANPELSELITSKIGTKWVTDLAELRKIEAFAEDEKFRRKWREIKHNNKLRLMEFISKNHEIELNPDSIFDSQVKRFHEYKRQLLNVLHVISLYNRIKTNPGEFYVPRTVIFGGKAAPSYYMAKLIIKLINAVAEHVNNDSVIGDKLKVLFIKNYGVTLAERIIPASDLSEQISTAGFEASGTGNMKFALNGAITIGTLDGANVEIKSEVGDDNIFIFGLTADEIMEARKSGYTPVKYYDSNPELKLIVDMLKTNYFNKSEPGIFDPIVNELLYRDYYFVMRDYEAYATAQKRVELAYMNAEMWTKMSIINSARMEKFSSDRAIKEYSKDIWHI
ncbi:MAG TPA: glycogen/starch/alpha-glucan phosphorylase [Ignavibacteria bacterium]|nr:glycogen/starch/alpha-glucan phosphorylase [Ignavibacteria bacterium]HRF67317.1 glycogen/starch/alpha-glucan phosphorylase [Ignavibacteria bacterium]HRJ05618.1 glycogen/starch/alpha-glucan phosphorylase [Ignavibacteria bacterium]HRJ86680.1 glycogen/starch/alpha-glucan phosphorylase [Ignavibacteria bacterium]